MGLIKKDWSDDRGHVWKKDEDGDIDMFGMDADTHNGPMCENCDYGFCHHCQTGPDEDCSRPALDGEFHEVGTQPALTHSANPKEES